MLFLQLKYHFKHINTKSKFSVIKFFEEWKKKVITTIGTRGSLNTIIFANLQMLSQQIKKKFKSIKVYKFYYLQQNEIKILKKFADSASLTKHFLTILQSKILGG